jgi:hypothetical protein
MTFLAITDDILTSIFCYGNGFYKGVLELKTKGSNVIFAQIRA